MVGFFFFFNDTATTEIYTLSLHDALPISGTIQNPWGSPRGLSVQTFDVYIDTDPGAGSGARSLLPGRNASLATGNGWEYGITIEGWEPAIYVAGTDGSIEETKPSFPVIVFGDKGKVIVRIPLVLVDNGDPSTWSYAVTLASQEGFPSTGVRRIRDVEAAASQWLLGGGPGEPNHTRIIDLAWPEPGEQETFLSDYTPEEFATIPLLTPEEG